MPDWKRIAEEFDSLSEEEREKIRKAFLGIPRERLEAYFLTNPYALKVYEKLGLPPLKPPLTSKEIEELKAKYKREFELKVRERGAPYREAMLRFEEVFSGWRDDVEHLAYKTKDEALKSLEEELASALEALAPAPIPTLPAPTWDHGVMMKVWWDIRPLFEASGVPPEPYRDEAFKLMTECKSEAEAREKLRKWAEEKIQEFAAKAPPTPTAPVPAVELVPVRRPYIVRKKCWVCGAEFTADLDLEKRLREAEILRFPALWYELCSKCKEGGVEYRGQLLPQWGFRSVEDAVAYRLAEGKAMAWKKTGLKGTLRVLTEDRLREIGLTEADIVRIRLAMSRWLPPEERE